MDTFFLVFRVENIWVDISVFYRVDLAFAFNSRVLDTLGLVTLVSQI